MVTEISGVSVDPSIDGDALSLPKALPIPSDGWPWRPFQIVSLLEMIEFGAIEFYGMLNGLIAVKNNLEEGIELTEERQHRVLQRAERAEFICSKYDIDVSYYTRRIAHKVEDPGFKPSLAVLVNEFRHCIVRELHNRQFMYMPDAEARYYEQEQLFGNEVHDSFPEAKSDIVSAGNCIACGLFTASVFHSMRVAEFGLRRIGDRLRVKLRDRGKPIPIEFGTWDKVIDRCKDKIKTMRQKPVGPKKQAALEFYSDAADHCLFMKDIWRNNISHTRQPYNEPEALAVLERVKDFMKFLTVNAP